MKNEIRFALHTYDIQYLVIALINSIHDEVIGDDNRERLIDQLGNLNAMCKESNNYTLTVTVNG